MQAVTTSGIVTGQVTIVGAGTCGLEATSGSPINYGTLADGEVSEDQIVAINNTGTSNTNIFVAGQGWIDDSQQPVMEVTNTHYSTTLGGVEWVDKNILTETHTDTGLVAQPGQEKSLAFQLSVNLFQAPGFTCQATQQVLLGADC